MLRLKLQNHGAIGGKGEFDFLFDVFGPDGGLQRASAMDIGHYRRDLELDRIYRGKGKLPFASTVPESVVEMAEACRLGKPVLLLTIHRNFRTAYDLFPHAKFLHLTRDPRDCAQSSIAMGWAGNAYYGAQPWIDAEQSWRRLKQAVSVDKLCEVKFEDVLAAPECEMRRICGFVGVAYDPVMLERAHPTYGIIDSKLANQWKSKSSVRDTYLVELRASGFMRELGYMSVSLHLNELSKLELLRLSFQNRLAKNIFGIHRFGILLWFAHKLAVRFPLTRITRRIINSYQ